MNYTVVSVLLILIGIIAYVVYTHKKQKQTKEDLANFLNILSQSFYEAKWIQIDARKNPGLTNAMIAQQMNAVFLKNLEYEFISLFPRMYYFPRGNFRFFSEDEASNKFIGKILPITRLLYEHYKSDKTRLEDIKLQFFNETEQLILLELDKEYKPSL